jgi:hypothetical protein
MAKFLPFHEIIFITCFYPQQIDNAAPKPKEQQHQANAAQQNQGGRGTGHNGGRGGGHHNGQNGGSRPPIQYTPYTGPQMTMAPAMIFTSDDWKYKLTPAQCDKLKKLKEGPIPI